MLPGPALRSVAALLALATLLPAHPSDRALAPKSSRRVALVIGNNTYPTAPLVAAVPDAKAVEASLSGLGFQRNDIFHAYDATLPTLKKVVRDFISAIRPGDTAFVYYAGHGVEVQGRNYLLPVNFNPESSELEVMDEAYAAQDLLDRLESSGARARILILDACRNNPLRRRAANRGLAGMEGSGTLIIFPTSAGKTTPDNGIFRRELLAGLSTPGLPADDAFKRIGRAVYQASKGAQTPAVYGLLLEDFSFVPGTQTQVARVSDADLEVKIWEEAQRLNTPAAYSEYLRQYPTGRFTTFAKLRSQPGAPPPPAPVRVDPPPTSSSTLTAGTKKLNPRDGLTYVWIPPGKFTMGCSPGDNQCYKDESPAHEVEITRGVWIGQTEVTQAAYAKLIKENPSEFKGANRPVESVSWDEAKRYCEMDGLRLPTEAEWEYAARAGSKEAQYGKIDQIAWYGGNSQGQTHSVAGKSPNVWGVYDMLGNVYEWVSDWYEAGYYAQKVLRDPLGPLKASDNKRVARGGSWQISSEDARTSIRVKFLPQFRHRTFGFRCAGNLP